MLLQVDGSRHDWLEHRGPRLTLVGGYRRCDRAPDRGHLPRAGGHRGVPRRAPRHGPPARGPARRCTATATPCSRRPRGSLMTLEEQLADTRVPTQLGRAFEEFGVTSTAAPTPGQGPHRARVGHAPGPPRQRAAARRRPSTSRGQRGSSPGSCRASTGASPCPRRTRTPPGGRCRPGPGSSGCAALKYRRVVANDHTVRVGATILQLPDRARAAGAMPAGGSRSSCGSTGGSSCGTASASWLAAPAPPPGGTPGARVGPASRSAQPPPSAAYRSGTIRPPTTPGARAGSTADASRHD